jgi:hypothetical protein
MINKLILIVFLILAVSCSKTAPTDPVASKYYYDPKIPYGVLKTDNTKDIVNVSNLKADVSTLDQVKLTWTIPPIYLTMNYEIYIYKTRDPVAGFQMPDPSKEASGADFYLRTKLVDVNFIDQNTIDSNGAMSNDIEQGTKYSYWVFVNIDKKYWSTGSRLDVLTKTPTTNFKLPEPSQFWDHKKWTLGYDPSVQGANLLNYLQSMDPGQSTPEESKGGIALAYAGNLAYFADTKNNRVLIYKRDGALSCNDLTDPSTQQACLMNYGGAPLTAANVLGQANTTSTYPCGDPLNTLGMNECLTHPTKVTVIGNKLFVSDSGNNRIVVFDTLPMYGCDINSIPGYVFKRECTPDWVIGKAGLLDTNTYSLGIDGKGSLNYPTDVQEYGSDLYIADTNNNRIVRINNYSNKDAFSCTATSWGSPACQFSNVFGQKDFTSNKTLMTIYQNDNTFIKNTPLQNLINDTYLNFPKRYFRNPTRIVFNSKNQMMVLSNEGFEIPNQIGGFSMLRSRISVFDNLYFVNDPTSVCSPATFDAGGCDSTIIIGQEDPNKLYPVASNVANVYDQLNSGFYSLLDFDIRSVVDAVDPTIVTEMMLAVNGTNNQIYEWRNWDVSTGLGYPASDRILNPEGALNTITNTLKPNLKNLCSIRFETIQNLVYVQDCGLGRRVYEIQAYDLPTN